MRSRLSQLSYLNVVTQDTRFTTRTRPKGIYAKTSCGSDPIHVARRAVVLAHIVMQYYDESHAKIRWAVDHRRADWEPGRRMRVRGGFATPHRRRTVLHDGDGFHEVVAIFWRLWTVRAEVLRCHIT
jgi:hypothetical protein